MNALVTISAVEVALLRCEAARRDVGALFDRYRGRELTDREDGLITAASDAAERAEAELRRAATEALGIDVTRVADALA